MKSSKTYKHVTNADGRIISSNLPTSCHVCVTQCNVKNEVVDACHIEKGKRRRGRTEKNNISIYLCSSCDELLKSSRLFRERLEVYEDFLGEFFGDTMEQIKGNASQDAKRLIHNLTSLNAHNIQEFFNLIPQENLSNNLRDQIKIVKAIIKDDPDAAAHTLLRIAKNNAAMKAEFSVFNKLYDPKPLLQPRPHNLRKVLLNVLHIFFQDFYDNYVTLEVADVDIHHTFDYESFSVALYHIIENATKYTARNSKLIVSFSRTTQYVDVVFDMLSIRILEGEIENLFKEGFSGHYADVSEKKGSGIGLHLVKMVLALNQAILFVERNTDPSKKTKRGKIEYEMNRFIIRFDTALPLMSPKPI